MSKYKTLFEKWQKIADAMSEIDIDNQSRYFTDFATEVSSRVSEYKDFAEREKTSFNEAELSNTENDGY